MKNQPPWPADRVERWPLARVLEAERNPRTHTDSQVEAIADSMREFGWTIPLLVDERGALIAGHGRLFAARKLELADAPVIVARGWTEPQKRAYRIADNKLALNAGWDAALLSAELAVLADEGFAVDLLGFSDADIARLIDDTDRLTLDHAARAANAADPTEFGFASANAETREQTSASTAADVTVSPDSISAVSDAGGLLAVFSCMVRVADRQILFDAIAHARTRGATDSGAALVLIAREWLNP
ncbi:ParB/Srx family N-terminal domain-containing protein [Paraburkholderia sp. 35.1]|uniref:ParB/Srx family N-terminal domain-containing protein n=1 Tax=Paraburkholderia sp. 35.1 TaxID=2991058 RepID=UPI003D1A67E7